MDNVTMVFHLDRLRKQQGLTFKELAKQSGVSLNTLHKIKTNTASNIGVVTIARLCVVLDCSPDQLMTLKIFDMK